MKRVFALAMAIMLTAVLAVPGLAIEVKSPTQKGAPNIQLASPYFFDEDGNPVGNADDEVKTVITPYQDKDREGIAGTVVQQGLESAYASYKEEFGTDARAMLNEADPSGNWYEKYPDWELRVVNIFDISLYSKANDQTGNGEERLLADHGDHWLRLKLTDADVSNFVALLHYYAENHMYDSSENVYWELIPTTRVGDEIFFSVKCSNLSPFAIVVKTRSDGRDDGGGNVIGGNTVDGNTGSSNRDSISNNAEPTSPQTGEPDNGGYWMLCVVFFAGIGVKMIYCGKKEKRYVH